MADRTFLDWPFFESRHRTMVSSLENWLSRDDVVSDHEADVDSVCRSWVNWLGRDGWLAHVVPAAYGGVSESFDVRTLCLIRETLARHDALADFAFAMQGLGTGALTLFGTEAQKERYLPDVSKGRHIAAFALSEAEAGSDVGALTTRGVFDRTHWVLDGQKTWISNGGIADHYLVFARTEDAPGVRGLSAFMV